MATGQSSRPRAARGSTSDEGALDPSLPQKKRARHRLIGAIALCLLAVVLLPLVFESEPSRPASEVAIQIPSRDTPLPSRGEPRATGTIEPAPPSDPPHDPAAEPAPVAAPSAPAAPAAEVAPAATAAAPAGTSAARAADPRPAPPKAAERNRPEAKASASGAAKRSAQLEAAGKGGATVDEIKQLADAALARAGSASAPQAPAATAPTPSATTAAPKAPTGARYLVQVGAYSTDAGAKQALERVASSGLTGYTERIKTDRGDRIRVRVGPFPSREAAEQARDRLKASGMEAALIAP
jgi:DedD protein